MLDARVLSNLVVLVSVQRTFLSDLLTSKLLDLFSLISEAVANISNDYSSTGIFKSKSASSDIAVLKQQANIRDRRADERALLAGI